MFKKEDLRFALTSQFYLLSKISIISINLDIFSGAGEWTLKAETCDSSSVPPEFSKVGNYFYQLIHGTQRDWKEAESACASMKGGHLPIPKSKDAIDSLTGLIQILQGSKTSTHQTLTLN